MLADIIKSDKVVTGVKVFTVFGALAQDIRANSENINLDLSSHSPGLYIITIYNENGFTSKEIIKNKIK